MTSYYEGAHERACVYEKSESRTVRDARSMAELRAGVGTVDLEP